MDDLLDDATNVAVALGEVEVTQLSRSLVAVGMAFENATALSLTANLLCEEKRRRGDVCTYVISNPVLDMMRHSSSSPTAALSFPPGSSQSTDDNSHTAHPPIPAHAINTHDTTHVDG